ncbi:M14 metallopeptidase family protein [Phenylobacterium sp. Root700]|uniref:M14 family metallopeptidase n=1 Tax=Phenylobacterium sp. Root700 TaxID=1736591 RepID=UPI0006FFB0E5|nr:M14 metallopeptidase family protein [Phenylobacterium sp. Root700]KRB52238.1 peptidase [Phenylobacterium sp. Root700]
MYFSRSLKNAAAVVAITIALGAPALAAPSGITSPKEAFGHDIGDDYFLANYTQLEAYFKTLAGQSDRMKLVDIGPTEEGRREYMAIVSSPANLAKLDRYREIARKLAKAEGVSEEEAKALAAEGKAVIWIDGGLHATEVVPPQALIAALHDMLTKDDAETRRILDDVIILFGQVNPDGQELVSNWYMRNADPAKREFGSLPRLYQKYIGHDNNRDYYMSAMKETTNVNRIFFREWYPQVVYNHHQTGPAGTVVFMPPFRDPFNYNYDPLVMATLSEVGSAMHSRLISEGKVGSTMRSGATYSTWNNGMERSITYFHNTVGLLTEIIGHPTPMQIPLIPKNQIARNDLPAPIAPQEWKFRQSIDYSMSINRAVLDYASRNRERLLMNIWRMGNNSIERGREDSWTVTPKRIEALEAAAKGKPLVGTGRDAGIDPGLYAKVLHDPALRDARGYIIPADQADLPTAVKFLNALIKTGVDVQRADKAFKVAGKSYPAGSYVVRADQAYRPHVLDMFEPQDHPHDFAYPGGPPIAPYDSTGYTLAMQMGVKFDRVLDAFDGPFQPVADVMAPAPGKIVGSGKAGYLVSHEANDSFILSNRLLKAGQGVYWVKAATKAVGKTFAPGALWVPATPANRAILEKATAELGVDAYALAKAPAGETLKLKPVRVGLVDKYGGVMTSGWTRWLMEQFEFDYQVVYPQRLDAGDLAKDFDVLVFTNGVLPSEGGEGFGGRQPKADDIPAEFRGWLGEVTEQKTAPQIAAFLQGGGSVVAIGPSTRLAKLVGAPVVDALQGADGKPLPRNSFYIPGSLLEVSVDNTQPLAFGAPKSMNVFFDRSPAFAAGAGARAAWYPQGDVLRSGWAVGQDKLVGTGAVLDLDVGKGKLFLMGPEVAQRAQSHASFKFLFNGLQYGPAITAGR